MTSKIVVGSGLSSPIEMQIPASQHSHPQTCTPQTFRRESRYSDFLPEDSRRLRDDFLNRPDCELCRPWDLHQCGHPHHFKPLDLDIARITAWQELLRGHQPRKSLDALLQDSSRARLLIVTPRQEAVSMQ